MVNARVGRCVYGATDAKAGALGSLYDLNADSRLNHRFNVHAGVLADECREVLSDYFSGLRGADGAVCGCGSDLEAHTAHAEALACAEDIAVGAVDFGVACRRPRRVLLAIDSFKGSVSSAQAESAVAGACAACGPMPRWPHCRWQMVARERSTPSPRAVASSHLRGCRPLGRPRVCPDAGGCRARVGCN